MDIENIAVKVNINNAKAVFGIDYDIDIAEKSGGLITQSALSKFLCSPETNNPTIRKIRGMAYGLKIEPWMLLVPNFPFDAIGHKPLAKISRDGYRLLAAFESLPDDKRKEILAFAAFQVRDDPASSRKIEDVRTSYAPRQPLTQTQYQYQHCTEDHEK